VQNGSPVVATPDENQVVCYLLSRDSFSDSWAVFLTAVMAIHPAGLSP
jgi:hypothetical protein